MLALIAVPRPPSEQWKEKLPKDEQEHADSLRLNEILMEFIHRWEANLQHAVPAARLIELPGAHHYLFQNEEAEVLRQIRTFLQTLH